MRPYPWSSVDDAHGWRVWIRGQNALQQLFVLVATRTEARQRLRATRDRRLELIRDDESRFEGVTRSQLLHWHADR